MRSEAGYDITSDVNLTSDRYSYNIKTRPSTGTFILKKGDSIVITYTAKAEKIKGDIKNTASVRDDNNLSWVSDDAVVPAGENTPPVINKNAKQGTYAPGDALDYTVDVKDSTKDLINHEIMDEIKEKKAVMNQDSVKVYLVSEAKETEITKNMIINVNDFGYSVVTKIGNKDFILKKGDTLRIIYSSVAQDVNGNIENTASTKSDNAPDWISDTELINPRSETPNIKKEVDKENYKKGDYIGYKVTVNGKRDLINPEIVDEISDKKAEMDQASVCVFKVTADEKTEITGDVNIYVDKYGYRILTKPVAGSFILRHGESIEVIYGARAKTGRGIIKNIARTRDDNNPNWASDYAVVPPVKDNGKNDPKNQGGSYNSTGGGSYHTSHASGGGSYHISGNAPKTGDDFNYPLIIGFLIAGLLVAAGTGYVIYRRKNL